MITTLKDLFTSWLIKRRLNKMRELRDRLSTNILRIQEFKKQISNEKANYNHRNA